MENLTSDYVDMNYVTPIQTITYIDKKIFLKRDDAFKIGSICGGKTRVCYFLSQNSKGLVTAGSRHSPQINIVAQIAKLLKIPCNAHCPNGALGEELLCAQNAGAQIFQHRAGYNSVIIKRAKDNAIANNFTYIPFGMECQEAVEQTRKQVANLPKECKRIVVTVGSGMSLAGILWGLKDFKLNIPVLGIVVGASPIKRLNKYAPKDWEKNCVLVKSKLEYDEHSKNCSLELPNKKLYFDSIYEAKCLPYLENNDCFWVIGIRQTENNNIIDGQTNEKNS